MFNNVLVNPRLTAFFVATFVSPRVNSDSLSKTINSYSTHPCGLAMLETYCSKLRSW